jgi:GT2 family glycosyltransferase
MPIFSPSHSAPVELSIVIVNWNSKNFVRECLRSLCDQVRILAYEVIVVDSASFDGCGEMLATEFPDVHFIQSQENLGFAKSNNLGVIHARAKTLLLLNPDTMVLNSAIESLFAAFTHQAAAGIMGCRLLNTDRTLQTSCVQSFPTILNQMIDSEFLRGLSKNSHLWGMRPLYAPGNGPHLAEAISGACMMVSKQIFDRVSGFSTHFFMYAEDMDLCYKVKQAGYSNYYFGGAEIVHHGGGSSQHAGSAFSNVMIRHSVHKFLKQTRGALYGFGFRCGMAASAVGRCFGLILCLPLALARGRMVYWRSSCGKWIAILRWGLGLEHWTAGR